MSGSTTIEPPGTCAILGRSPKRAPRACALRRAGGGMLARVAGQHLLTVVQHEDVNPSPVEFVDDDRGILGQRFSLGLILCGQHFGALQRRARPNR